MHFIEFLKGNLDIINGIDGAFRDQVLTRTGQLQPRFAGKFDSDNSTIISTRNT